MKRLWQIILILVFIACNNEGSGDNGVSGQENSDQEIIREKAIKDVDQIDFDFNNDGMNDAIKQVTVNQDGHHRVIHVFIQEEHGFVPTYDNDDNQMVYPGDSIVQVSDEKFKFMYHGGDYFLFKFEEKDGQWIARQTE